VTSGARARLITPRGTGVAAWAAVPRRGCRPAGRGAAPPPLSVVPRQGLNREWRRSRATTRGLMPNSTVIRWGDQKLRR
jgi:hypothetical protein